MSNKMIESEARVLS